MSYDDHDYWREYDRQQDYYREQDRIQDYNRELDRQWENNQENLRYEQTRENKNWKSRRGDEALVRGLDVSTEPKRSIVFRIIK